MSSERSSCVPSRHNARSLALRTELKGREEARHSSALSGAGPDLPRVGEMRRLLLPLVALLLLLVPASAQAGQRWASPTSRATSGPCLATSPCRIDYAVSGARTGDEVIVTSGTYTLDAPLAPAVPIALRGEAGQPRPRLVGTGNVKTTVVSLAAGGVLRHLSVQATAKDADALTMNGGLAEDVLLASMTGDGGTLTGSVVGTLLRDAVVRTSAAAGDRAGLKLRESGAVMLRNVTVMAPNGTAVGIRCEVKENGDVSLVNVLARGAGRDIDAERADGDCSAANSNFRIARSPGVAVGAGNQQSTPLFRDAAVGD